MLFHGKIEELGYRYMNMNEIGSDMGIIFLANIGVCIIWENHLGNLVYWSFVLGSPKYSDHNIFTTNPKWQVFMGF